MAGPRHGRALDAEAPQVQLHPAELLDVDPPQLAQEPRVGLDLWVAGD